MGCISTNDKQTSISESFPSLFTLNTLVESLLSHSTLLFPIYTHTRTGRRLHNQTPPFPKKQRGDMELLDWRSIGSIMATIMFLRTALKDFLPPEVYNYLFHLLSRVIALFNTHVTILIDEFESYNTNELFELVQSYLSSKCFQSSTDVLRVSKPRNSLSLTFTMAERATRSLDDVSIPDLPVRWTFRSVAEKKSTFSYRHRSYELSFHKSLKERVHSEYLPYVMEQAANVRFKSRERRLYTNRSDGKLWSHVPFHHPANFGTIAIDPVMKHDLMTDLTKFVSRRDYYSRVGRSWKRGYLLFGPPGTGKTSLIAAIANFLQFDIYDLELTAVTSNSDLRRLLISTSSKSVIVIEDIDCTLDLSSRSSSSNAADDNITADENTNNDEKEEKSKNDEKDKKKSKKNTLSLSGVLNFVDGLWSSCVGERLMIFTTNHKEKLDPALLRAGRMDKHIHLSFCLMPAFRILAKNYLYMEEDHEMYKEVEELLPEAKITPADVAEMFMSCNDDSTAAMKIVVEDLRRRVAAMPTTFPDVKVHPLRDNSSDDIRYGSDDENKEEESTGEEETDDNSG